MCLTLNRYNNKIATLKRQSNSRWPMRTTTYACGMDSGGGAECKASSARVAWIDRSKAAVCTCGALQWRSIGRAVRRQGGGAHCAVHRAWHGKGSGGAAQPAWRQCGTRRGAVRFIQSARRMQALCNGMAVARWRCRAALYYVGGSDQCNLQCNAPRRDDGGQV